MRLQLTVTLAVMILPAPRAAAQRASLGAMVGGYGNSDFVSRHERTPGFLPTVMESDSAGYIAGPALEIRLLPKLWLGAEALYKPLHYQAGATFQNGVLVGYAPASVITWQFPVLARYKFSLGRTEPFLEAGPSFRAAGNLNQANPSRMGATAGVGMEFGWRKLRVAPRVRYTRWSGDSSAGIRTRPGQLEFLAGFSYAADSSYYPLSRRVTLGAVLVSHVAGETRSSTDTALSETIRTISDPRGPAVGPLLEVSLWRRMAVEISTFPRTFRYTSRRVDPDASVPLHLHAWSSWSSGTWEIPVWLKYRFATGAARPFVAMGPSFRLPKEFAGIWLSNYGVTAGAGLEMPMGRFRVSPALRYTRWGAGRPRAPGAQVDSVVLRDQFQISVGISGLHLTEEGAVRPLGGRVALGAVLAAPVTGEFSASTDGFQMSPDFPPVTLRTASAPRGPALGPLVEVGLTPRISIEGSAIRRRFRASLTYIAPGGSEHSQGFAVFPFAAGWEFPVWTKYKLGAGAWRPFLAMGPSFRQPVESSNWRLSTVGASAGAGVEFSWKGATIAPALRYSYWAANHPLSTDVRPGIYRNQLQWVVAISRR